MDIGIQYLVYHPYTKSWTPINNNMLSFYGTGGYGTPVNKGEYNSSLHLRSSESDLDLCINPHLPNLKYVDVETVKVSELYECKLKELSKQNLIKLKIVSEIPIKVEYVEFFTFMNSGRPVKDDLDVKLCLYGYPIWLDLSAGLLRKKVRTDHNTVHELYFGLSVSPMNIEKNIEFNIGNRFYIRKMER